MLVNHSFATGSIPPDLQSREKKKRCTDFSVDTNRMEEDEDFAQPPVDVDDPKKRRNTDIIDNIRTVAEDFGQPPVDDRKKKRNTDFVDNRTLEGDFGQLPVDVDDSQKRRSTGAIDKRTIEEEEDFGQPPMDDPKRRRTDFVDSRTMEEEEDVAQPPVDDPSWYVPPKEREYSSDGDLDKIEDKIDISEFGDEHESSFAFK